MFSEPLRLAVWSGPRNISTALMRSWNSRPDTFVVDEPFYAHFLQETRVDHPAIDEVIAHHETNWQNVIDMLLAQLPEGKTVFYQKQMNKHILPHINMDWTKKVTNCFLIREPKEMITSFMKIVPNMTLEEFGLTEQVGMFKKCKESTGTTPIVVDSKDVLMNPRKILGLWCEALGIEFMDCMLSWEPGIHATDGIWAPHWYNSVIQSTGFASYKAKNEEVPETYQNLRLQCEELYEELYQYRIH